jgi:hypothetical protein
MPFGPLHTQGRILNYILNYRAIQQLRSGIQNLAFYARVPDSPMPLADLAKVEEELRKDIHFRFTIFLDSMKATTPWPYSEDKIKLIVESESMRSTCLGFISMLMSPYRWSKHQDEWKADSDRDEVRNLAQFASRLQRLENEELVIQENHPDGGIETEREATTTPEAPSIKPAGSEDGEENRLIELWEKLNETDVKVLRLIEELDKPTAKTIAAKFPKKKTAAKFPKKKTARGLQKGISESRVYAIAGNLKGLGLISEDNSKGYTATELGIKLVQSRQTNSRETAGRR